MIAAIGCSIVRKNHVPWLECSSNTWSSTAQTIRLYCPDVSGHKTN